MSKKRPAAPTRSLAKSLPNAVMGSPLKARAKAALATASGRNSRNSARGERALAPSGVSSSSSGRNLDSSSDASSKSEDVALICGPAPDGNGLAVIRKRNNRIEAGTVRPIVQGKPLQGDIVQLKPRNNTPWLCDVQVQYEKDAADSASSQESPASRSGPPQVATEKYRKNWDTIWSHGSKSPSRGVLN